MSDLFVPVVSITATKRRRFLWAAWWTGPPTRVPFRKPDASSGGARTREEALSEASALAGARLVEIEGAWARAYARTLRGEAPFPSASRTEAVVTKPDDPTTQRSVWDILGVPPSATADEIKRAYRAKALETHPDRGGTDAAFREVRRAYESALERRGKADKRPKRRHAP